MRSTREIRSEFLNYFQKKGHLLLPSSAVVPHNDPTLLFTNAGMNQFKDLFLGKSTRDYKKATTSQKCIRAGGKHNDLENVGHTKRHLTFFEMLGNFSFGDYFKKEAIASAWEVTTEVFKLDADKVWASVFREDDEAYELWKAYLPEKRIVRLDEKDNFWMMGDTGPCGPCSELLYDRGPDYGNASSPLQDSSGERFQEFWNLVFMQYDKINASEQLPLPNPCIDTGAGLERVVGLIQNVDNVFETDILRAIIAAIEEKSQIAYRPQDTEKAPAFRVIADHLRSLCFAIADGAAPSNVERGYVLRKILRRAVRYGKMLGFEAPFLSDLLPTLIREMGDAYPELQKSQEPICEILSVEEEAFFKTLRRGGNILAKVIEEAKEKGEEISGDDAFKLKDTYGLPLEEIELIAVDHHLKVDFKRYEALEMQAKERSKAAHKGSSLDRTSTLFAEIAAQLPESCFIGYDADQIQAEVLAIIVEQEKGFQKVSHLQAGQEALIILDRTPFYAEKGGQVGDQGSLRSLSSQNEESFFAVSDCQTPYKGLIAHHGQLQKGALSVGDKILAFIDTERRQKIANNHTATHLLHFSLEQILGSHIKQAGSVVDEGRLRFDFNHHKALSSEEIRAIERQVNSKVRENIPVATEELPYAAVMERREVKQFFGDKYDQLVRLVDIQESKELCGGTHAKSTGQIGFFKIVAETSIGAGVRRIEAVTGSLAEDELYLLDDQLKEIAAKLKTPQHLLNEKIERLLDERASLEKQLALNFQNQLAQLASTLTAKSKQVKEITLICALVDVEIKALKDLADKIGEKCPSAIIALAAHDDERCQLLVKISKELIAKGYKANALVQQLAPYIDGKGGGKPEMAQAGGKADEKVAERLKTALSKVEELL